MPDNIIYRYKYKQKVVKKNKVKLSLHIPWRYTWEMEVQLFSFLSSALDGCEWSASHPATLPPGRAPWYPVNRVLGRPWSQPGSFGDKSRTPSRIPTPDHPACSPVTILIMLSINTSKLLILWRLRVNHKTLKWRSTGPSYRGLTSTQDFPSVRLPIQVTNTLTEVLDKV